MQCGCGFTKRGISRLGVGASMVALRLLVVAFVLTLSPVSAAPADDAAAWLHLNKPIAWSASSAQAMEPASPSQTEVSLLGLGDANGDGADDILLTIHDLNQWATEFVAISGADLDSVLWRNSLSGNDSMWAIPDVDGDAVLDLTLIQDDGITDEGTGQGTDYAGAGRYTAQGHATVSMRSGATYDELLKRPVSFTMESSYAYGVPVAAYASTQQYKYEGNQVLPIAPGLLLDGAYSTQGTQASLGSLACFDVLNVDSSNAVPECLGA